MKGKKDDKEGRVRRKEMTRRTNDKDEEMAIRNKWQE